MTAAPDDRAAFFEALRASTARLLKLDPATLSPAQAVRVDRAASLRLTLDGMQSAQLAGREIDVKAFVAASQELERLLGGEPDAPTSVFASSKSRNKLRLLIDRTLMLGADDAAAAADTLADTMRREEMAAVEAASPVPPVTAPPPQRAANVVALDPNSRRPPSHYLKDGQPREAWESGGGALCAPAWSPPDEGRK